MSLRLSSTSSLVLAGLIVTACSSNDGDSFPPMATGGSYTTTPGTTGGNAQGGGLVGKGGSVVGQGGATTTVPGTSVGGKSTGTTNVGGATTNVGGATTNVGGTKATGGATTSTGSTKATGGATTNTGGTKATGGVTSTTGGTKATGGTSTTGGTPVGTGGAAGAATQNVFTIGPYTGAGWVAGGKDLTTFTNPTISGTTQTFASKTALCMSASIPALQKCTTAGVVCGPNETMNYAENWGAMIALNTTPTEGTPKGNTFSNIAVTYTGSVTPATAEVRLQVELKDGSNYCFNGYASGLQVTVDKLIKNCYDRASTTALTTADTANITSIQLSVASSEAAETISNLCVTDIKLDGTTTNPGTTTCTDSSTATGSVTGAYGRTSIPTTSGSKSYVLQANWWTGYAGQTENYSGLGFTINGAGTFKSPQEPLGYPSLYIGSYQGNSSVGSNLPKQVSALTKVPTSFKWSGANDVSRFNASYDVWFTSSGSPLPASQSNPGSGGAYLMVWMFMPSDQTPRGSKVDSAVTIPGTPGTWTAWYDPSGAAPCVSYVANSKLNELSFDLNEFIKHAATKGWGVKNSQYLSVVFGGFEIWDGHSGLKLDNFCAQVN